jgi:LysM repeat protein
LHAFIIIFELHGEGAISNDVNTINQRTQSMPQRNKNVFKRHKVRKGDTLYNLAKRNKE